MSIFRAGLVFIMALGGSYHAAHAEDALTTMRIISGDEIALSDGRTLRLAGIKADMPEAKSFLETNVTGRAVALQDATQDRYGRTVATVYVEGQNQSLQDEMLSDGLAFVYPALGNEPQLDAMLQSERAARQTGRGYWATHSDTPSDDAGKLYGKYAFVTGAIVKAERVKDKLYLNFGPDWHTAFTVMVAAHDLRAFKNAGIDLPTWEGKKVRVRGWIKRDFGPRVTVTDPHQIELVP